MLEGHNDVFCYSHTKTSSTIGFLNELPKKKTITIIDGNEEDHLPPKKREEIR